jgi:hypothetical protein
MKTISVSANKTAHTSFVAGWALVLMLLSCTSAFAGTLLVDDDKAECPGAGFQTIQGAVDAATAGDVIQVCPGTYHEQVQVTKPVSLIGVKRDNEKAAVIQPLNMVANTTGISDFLGGNVPVAAAVLVTETFNVALKDIIVDGADNGITDCGLILIGIYYRNASGTISSTSVRNFALGPGLEDCPNGLGIYTDSNAEGTSDLLVTDSSIHDCQSNGITGVEPETNLRAIGNAVTGRLLSADFAHVGIALGFDAKGSIENNNVTNLIHPQCTSVDNCDASSTGILVFFTTSDVKVIKNVVGKTQTGIFVVSSGVSVIQNKVFDTDVFDRIAVIGDNNAVKDNSITNSDESSVFVQGTNNTIRDNTTNETPIGLLVTPGNNVLDNQVFNTSLLREVFDPGSSAASSPSSLRPAVIARSVLSKGSISSQSVGADGHGGSR